MQAWISRIFMVLFFVVFVIGFVYVAIQSLNERRDRELIASTQGTFTTFLRPGETGSVQEVKITVKATSAGDNGWGKVWATGSCSKNAIDFEFDNDEVGAWRRCQAKFIVVYLANESGAAFKVIL
jgi:hypothetical protein